MAAADLDRGHVQGLAQGLGIATGEGETGTHGPPDDETLLEEVTNTGGICHKTRVTRAFILHYMT